MRLSLTVAVIAGCTALAAPGCGSSAPDTLTCGWLASDANCWKSTALMATACLPPDTEMGTFSADASTCTYASGIVVTFAPPLVLPLPTTANMNWNFTVTDANGQACLHYQDTGNGLTLTVNGQTTVKEGLSGNVGISISCPDGTHVQTSNALNLFNCPDGSFTDLPGLFWSSSPSGSAPPFYVSAGITGTGDSSVPAFNCTQ
ncbi:MAG TPA: hypothetical protein VKQ32_27275 [Polyangia bacterium]|nr:hypothetical protein [Polyangia bacterium]